MRTPLLLALALIATVALTACSVQLTEQGKKVGLVTASTADRCDLIKLFTAQGSSPDETLRIAFNEAAKLGADSMAVASGREIASGSEINAAALICHR